MSFFCCYDTKELGKEKTSVEEDIINSTCPFCRSDLLIQYYEDIVIDSILNNPYNYDIQNFAIMICSNIECRRLFLSADISTKGNLKLIK